jgi:hypothetical protein
MTLIASNLTPDEEARLRATFAEEEPAPHAVP